ncbi:MAG: gamma-glutamyl-gamma-aminobutyrate hydrolase family protein [Eubacteriales bacterium]|nr:gamma-glutamyl-gamma-aminobutyrate hydrolase family protein [Eubacteriales bacterium]
MKPVIGVMPLWDDEKDSIWMLPGYMDGILQAGGTPIIFPFSNDEEELAMLVGLCGGLLFTGGHDVDPQLYGEQKLEGLVTCCGKRDEMEKIVLELALQADKPVLGICRGIQFINAAMGGTLYQDLPLQHPSEIIHRQQPPFDAPAHEVNLTAGSPLCECLEARKISVNSYHHQAVRDPACGLEVMAVSPDGLIEALYAPDRKYLWAVQWHPEFSYRTDNNSRKIFQSFVNAAG